jgi:parvulin-like peptidyl-prolyl isomerase
LAKKKQQQPKREMTHRERTRHEQQARRRRMFLIMGLSIIGVVAGILGSAWYREGYRPLRETVIQVNDRNFNMGYYIDMLKYQGQFYEQVYGPGQSATYGDALATQTEELIKDMELVRQTALGLGYSVSDSEVKQAIKDAKSPPKVLPPMDLVRYQLLAQELLGDYFDKQVPTTGEQRHILAMFLESESQATSVRARIDAGEDFVTLAKELSLDQSAPNKDGDFGWHPKGILAGTLGLSVVDDYGFSVDVGTLSQPRADESRTKPVGYWLAKLLGRETDNQGEQYHLEVMLLGSEAEAQDIKARLEAGEDFATLAKASSQHSQSKDKGGDLGWLNADDIQPVLKDFALNGAVDTLSEPVRDDTVTTTGGYWLIKLVEKDDNRQLSDDDRTYLKQKAFSDWVTSLSANPLNVVNSYLNDSNRAWAISKALS